MRPQGERPVPQVEQLDRVGEAEAPDWESVRIFLNVVRCGSFRAASEKISQSVNSLRRQVEVLEGRLKVRLLNRRVDGVSLTPEGERIYVAAQKMEVESFGLLFASAATESRLKGEVRVAITEGLSTFWVLPQLIEFQKSNPEIVLDLRCAMKSADVMRLEADLAIQLVRPTSPDLKVYKLGYLHTMAFAAPSYLATYGLPHDLSSIRKGKIVLQEAEQLTTQAEYEQLFPGVPQEGFVSIKNNVGSGHLWAIIRGAGIGMLPTYVPAIGCDVVPIDIDVRRRYEIWLTFHPEVNNIPRIRSTIDWVIDSFSQEKYPWFREEFIHPDQFQSMNISKNLPRYEQELYANKNSLQRGKSHTT